MSERQDELDLQGWRTSFTQTTEEMARAVVAAAAAVRPRPSIVFSANNSSSGRTLEKLQRSLTRVWRQGMARDNNRRAFFNPEHLTSQKRQWNQLQMQMLERKRWTEPDCIFEHMVVVGLHPDTDTDTIEATLLRRRAWERELDGPERLRDVMWQQLRGSSPSLPEPEILFAYPPGKRLPMRQKDLLAFCFPGGVEAQLVERTPSLSELNEIEYGQDNLMRDDLSYTFLLKVADNATMYGVCMYVPQLVKQPPGIMAVVTGSQPRHLPLSRFSVAAYRCYCFLTKLPFFDLHFDVLNSIVTQERLERITECVHEMTVGSVENGGEEVTYEGFTSPSHSSKDGVSISRSNDAANASVHGAKSNGDFVKMVHPEGMEGHDSVQIDDPVIKSRQEFIKDVDPSNHAIQERFQKGDRDFSVDDTENKSLLVQEQSTGEAPPVLNIIEDEDGTSNNQGTASYMNLQGESNTQTVTSRIHRAESVDSVNSMVESHRQSINSEDDEGTEEASSSGQDYYLESRMDTWAEVDNCLLRILQKYHKLPIPARGSSLLFQPLEHLRPLKFMRLADETPTLLGGRTLDLRMCRTSLEVVEMQAALTAAEEALALSTWTVATVCRVLSLENVLALFAGVLLEKQIVVVCPNLGVLSAVVLSAIPLIRPFQWQSLMLPILPYQMLDFLDAPVPYIVGVQHKNSALRGKSSVIVINVQRDKVSMPSTPQLPHLRELMSALQPYHSRLAAELEFARKHPVHVYNDAQFHAAGSFLAVLRSYLESLCGNLRSHTITNVQSNNDKVSLLLKESFVEDFDSRDHSFMKLFVDTQLFSVHTDAVLSFIESD